MTKRAGVYARVSTHDQHIETQLYQLRDLAVKRGYEVVVEYADRGISGAKARRPGLDALMADARHHKFDIVFVAAFDRIARSTRHFLQVLDELESLGIEFSSAREAIDTSGPMGRMFLVLAGAFSEMERSLLVDRIKLGMKRAKIEGQRLGRAPIELDRESLVRDRLNGMSLTNVAKKYQVSRSSVVRIVREAKGQDSGVGQNSPIQVAEVA
jgi:DNA invertase Pin-like site-specific DNA recombinase